MHAMTRTEAIQELIRLGELSRAYWNTELHRRHPKYPIIQHGEDSGPPPPEDKQIHDLLNALPERDLYILLTLMYLGRGDFDLDHLALGYRKMKDAFPKRELAIDQMTGRTVLSEYLMDALEEIRQGHIDLDSQSFETSVAS
jgi:hypothetical protein